MRKPADIEERETAARLFEEWWAADVAVNNATQDVSDEDFAKLKIRAEKAQHDYKSQPLRVLDYRGTAERCAFSHAPLLESDETLLVLSSAIGAENYDEHQPMLPEMV